VAPAIIGGAVVYGMTRPPVIVQQPPVVIQAPPPVPVYIQPIDEQDEQLNKLNELFAVKMAIEHGYRLSLQLHKILKLP
jgi:organic radical activating enzyme